MNKIKLYYILAKPGIIYGNLLMAVAGFFFAAGLAHRANGGDFDFALFIALAVGTALVIGSACAFNNYTDRKIDAKMERTKDRALVQNAISPRNALIYAVALGILGANDLFLYTNTLTACLELFGLFSYVVLYGLAKRYTPYGVLVGSLPGAMPIVAGYAAVADHLGLAALILFIILVVWQMPHFYGIALYRADEYRAAGIPILPVRKGIRRTKIEMLIYAILFLFATLSLTYFHFTGWIYFSIMAVAGVVWIYFSIQGFKIPDTDAALVTKWARKMFLYSLIAITVFSVAVSIGAIVP